MEETLPLYPEYELTQAQAQATQIQKMENANQGSAASPPSSELFNRATLLLGPENAVTTCPFCQKNVRTTIKHTVTTRTHMTAVLCCLICCCCCLPYCCNSARNTDHYCPSCLKFIGTYEK